MTERYLDAAKQDEWFSYRGLDLHECFRQEYAGNNCIIASGLVEGADPDVDTIYLCLEKDNVDSVLLLFRPDEATALAIAMNSAIWSKQLQELHNHE